MQKKSVEIKVLSFLMITILIISLVSSSVSAEKFVNKIQRITGLAFGDYGYCNDNLAKNSSSVTGKQLVGCLDYCNEYYEFNLNELNNYKNQLDSCYKLYIPKIQNYSSQLKNCYSTQGNSSEVCSGILSKLKQQGNSAKNCNKKYQKNIDKYQNIFDNCDQVEEFVYETHPYNSEIYSAYLNAKGTDCIKTTKKDREWNPTADVNKDGKVDDNDFKLIIANIENDTWGELAYIDARDYCEVTCFDAGGADLCKQDEVCLGNSVQIKDLGGNCCDKVCRSCLDSDDSIGRQYIDFGIFTAGNVTDKNLKYKEDACGDVKKLKEQYCSEKGSGKTKNIKCPSQSCENDACLPSKCSNSINKCTNTGEPLCEISSTNKTFDCACIPPGYFQKAVEVEKEIKKPFKDRKNQIENALEEDSGFSIGSLAIGIIGGIALGALGAMYIGGTLFSVSVGGISYSVSAGSIIGGQIGNQIGSYLGSGITGSVINKYNETLNQTYTLPINITSKSKLIRELTWIQYKLDSIKVEVRCDEYEKKVYLDCTGAAACQEKVETFYSG